MCSFYHKKNLWSIVGVTSLGILFSFGALAKKHTARVPVREIQRAQAAFASLENYTPFPDLSQRAPQHQLQTLAHRYAYLEHKNPQALIQAAVRQHALVHHIPLTVALGISGHESGGWQMWQEKSQAPLANINYHQNGHVASTDWGVMQINDRAHPEAFPRARQDIAYNIAFGMALLAETHKVYRGSLNLGFGAWDTTIAAYHLGHAPAAAEMPQVQRYIKQMKTLLQTEQLLPEIVYTIQPGDTLERIANRHYGRTQQWERIWQHNQGRLADPAHLPVGIDLRIPLS